jgi:zinc and cadmium transporter
MQTWVLAIGSVLVVSALSAVGALVFAFGGRGRHALVLLLVSFAVGALFGDAFIHLLPETFEKLGTGLSGPALVIAGVLAFFVLEKFLRWRHCHLPTTDGHPHPIVWMNLVGDGVHNFIDGMIIGASYVVSVPIGLASTLAVVLHEIPQEIGDFGVLIHGGLTVRRALFYNLLSALVSLLGAAFALIVGPWVTGFSVAVLPVAAGGFIYIAGSDLIPEMQHEVDVRLSFLQLGAIVTGVAVMAALKVLG